MYFIKRLFLFLFIALLIVSVYKDITSGHNILGNPPGANQESVKFNFEVKQIKVKSGETVLSIIEKINNHDIETVNMGKIISDFKLANPTADPFQLQAGNYYYFPLYPG